jgi:hypothetical protein
MTTNYEAPHYVIFSILLLLSLNVTNQVLHPYKTAAAIIIASIIYIFTSHTGKQAACT